MVGLGRRYRRFGRMSVVSQMFRGDIDSRLDMAKAASPSGLVTRKTPPFLIYHGDRDWLVPPDQGFKLYSALRMNGVPSKFVDVKNKGHAFDLGEPQIGQGAAFFHKHL